MPEKTFYQRIEGWFEGFVGTALKLYGHPATFVAALILVIFFLVKGADKAFEPFFYTLIKSFPRHEFFNIKF